MVCKLFLTILSAVWTMVSDISLGILMSSSACTWRNAVLRYVPMSQFFVELMLLATASIYSFVARVQFLRDCHSVTEGNQKTIHSYIQITVPF